MLAAVYSVQREVVRSVALNRLWGQTDKRTVAGLLHARFGDNEREGEGRMGGRRPEEGRLG